MSGTVGNSGADQATPNLATLVQAIADRPGWISGNASGFTFDGTGSHAAVAYDTDPAEAPTLHIT